MVSTELISETCAQKQVRTDLNRKWIFVFMSSSHVLTRVCVQVCLRSARIGSTSLRRILWKQWGKWATPKSWSPSWTTSPYRPARYCSFCFCFSNPERRRLSSRHQDFRTELNRLTHLCFYHFVSFRRSTNHWINSCNKIYPYSWRSAASLLFILFCTCS